MMENNITGFQHLGMPVANLERSKAFYARLGFKEVMVSQLPEGAEAVQVSMMELNRFLLELYQLTGSERAAIAARTDGHIDHFALDVRDIDAAFAAVREAGLEPIEQAPVFLPFWEKGIYYFVIRGPDGEKVEFCQRLK